MVEASSTTTICGDSATRVLMGKHIENRSVNNDREIHALMNRAIEVIDPCCCEWPDLHGIAINLHIIDGGCSWLCGWLRGSIGIPRPIAQNMDK